jgi:PAS domain S-box-containing protein
VQFLKRLRATWTQPITQTQNTELTQQIHTMISLLLITTLFSYASTIASAVLNFGGNAPWLLPTLAITSILWLPYILARRGHLESAATVTTIWTSLQLLAVALALPEDQRLAHLNYLVTGTVFASFFLSVPRAAIAVFASCILYLVAGPRVLGLSTAEIIQGPVTFNLVCACLILIFAHFWQKRETNKQVALKTSEAHYRMMSESISDFTVLYHFDEDGRAVRQWIVGAYEEITGYSVEDIPPTNADFLYHPDDVNAIQSDRLRTRRGQRYEGDYRIIRKDGDVRWVRILRVPVWDDKHQKLIGYYGVVTDIHARKLAEEQKAKLTLQREQFSLVRNFVRAIAHDFRTRLSVIENNRYLINKMVTDEPTREKVMPRLEITHEAIQQMAAQISHLVTVTDWRDPKPSPIDLNQLLDRIALELDQVAQSKGIHLKIEKNAQLPLAHVDLEQLNTALTQLVSNALAFTPDGGSVILRTDYSGHLAIITVEDTGYGISPEALPRIFEPFYKADKARSTATAGIGIGLTIVKMVADSHHGEIHVTSEEGRGSCFQLSLPLRTPEISRN